MKFIKEEAYKELVAQLTEKGETLQLSERTLNKMLNTYYEKFVTEDTELTDFVNEYLADFKELDGNFRKDKSDFVQEYEKANPKETKPIVEVDDNKPKTELELLSARLESLELERAELIKTNSIAQKKSELVSKMEELGIKDKAWTTDFLSEITISDDMDIESKASSYLKLYNLQKANPATDATPLGADYSEGGGVDADLNAMKKRQEEKMSREINVI